MGACFSISVAAVDVTSSSYWSRWRPQSCSLRTNGDCGDDDVDDDGGDDDVGMVS